MAGAELIKSSIDSLMPSPEFTQTLNEKKISFGNKPESELADVRVDALHDLAASPRGVGGAQ